MDDKEFAWRRVKNLMQRMDARLDEDTRVELMEACGRACACAGPPRVAADCHGNLDRRLGILAEWHGGDESVRRDAETVEVPGAECLCDLVVDAAGGSSSTCCACSLGRMNESVEAVLGRAVRFSHNPSDVGTNGVDSIFSCERSP